MTFTPWKPNCIIDNLGGYYLPVTEHPISLTAMIVTIVIYKMMRGQK